MASFVPPVSTAALPHCTTTSSRITVRSNSADGVFLLGARVWMNVFPQDLVQQKERRIVLSSPTGQNLTLFLATVLGVPSGAPLERFNPFNLNFLA